MDEGNEVRPVWKVYTLLAWNKGLHACLEKVAEDTKNKWDNWAVDAANKMVNQVLG